jgi:hypothetical protein
VDVANNRRDNMTNFHDVMRTYRWELRCLSFFLGVTEANTFSAYKYFNPGGKQVNHGEFRWRLAQSLEFYIKELQEGPTMELRRTRSHLDRPNGHRLVTMGKNGQGNYIRRQCKECRVKPKQGARVTKCRFASLALAAM